MAIYLGTNNLAGIGGGGQQDNNGTITPLPYPDISQMPVVAFTYGSVAASLSNQAAVTSVSGNIIDNTSSNYFTHTTPATNAAVTNQDVLNISNANGGALTSLIISSNQAVTGNSNTSGTQALSVDIIIDGTTTTFVVPRKGAYANSSYVAYGTMWCGFGGYNLIALGGKREYAGGSSAYAYAYTTYSPTYQTLPDLGWVGTTGGNTVTFNNSNNNLIHVTKADATGGLNSSADTNFRYVQLPVKTHFGLGLPWLKFNSTLQIRYSRAVDTWTSPGSAIFYGQKFTF